MRDQGEDGEGKQKKKMTAGGVNIMSNGGDEGGRGEDREIIREERREAEGGEDELEEAHVLVFGLH